MELTVKNNILKCAIMNRELMRLQKQLDSKKRRWAERRTFGTNCKNPPKITFEKFVKLSGHTCVCNTLTSFEYKVHKNRKRKLCKAAENCFEKLVKSHLVNLFLAYFTHLKPQCAGRQNDCDTVGCVAITAPYSLLSRRHPQLASSK